MPSRTQIVNGKGRAVTVGPEGEIGVAIHPHPPVDEEVYALPFYQYLSDDGTSSGSEDMIINGGTTPTDFYIGRDSEKDIFISRINFLISDAGAELDEFGNLTALTNGLELFYETGDTGRVTVSENVTTNLELVRLAGGKPAFGADAGAFRFQVSGAGAESYMAVIDFREVFGLIWGMRLRKNTSDKIGIKIQDNMTGIETMNAFATGFKF